MSPIERKVKMRRIKRRLKAGVSIVIALAAGTFLACQKEEPKDKPRPAPNPTTPEDANLPAPDRPDAGADGDAADGAFDADADAGKDAGDAARRAVDKREHKKGMPVKDNLLE